MTKQTLHTQTLNLLPLRRVLLAAERDAPSRVPILDMDEQRALQLIEKMKAAHALTNPFAGFVVESPRPTYRAVTQEMVKSHA